MKVKNTSAIPLRAAYLRGPYTLYSACYPSDFNPNARYPHPELEGIPQFEPNLRAGGNWHAIIPIPEQVRLSPGLGIHQEETPGRLSSLNWTIEIVSQVIFSTTAAVHFEVLIGRDQKSLEWSTASVVSIQGLPPPADLNLQQQDRLDNNEGQPKPFHVTKGVFSRSVRILVEDTKSLWNSPPFPTLEDKEKMRAEISWRAQNSQKACSPLEHDEALRSNVHDSKEQVTPPPQPQRKKRVHFVVVTHGLHSNLGADMLFLKESIDAVVSEKSRSRGKRNSQSEIRKEEDNNYDVDNPDDGNEEQIIVRGFAGNAVRTERGIQYLGKRLAKYVLLMTYPDQPYLPPKPSKKNSFFSTFKTRGGSMVALSGGNDNGQEALTDPSTLPYQITSISFIGHSLGGLVQTYAIAYIQKYSPQFFDHIKPINFIALATPFLGLSNENPIYVKFALDFGLVGRTGQDLGLSWTAPKVRSGWTAIIAGVGTRSQNQQTHDTPASKPLLRILPAGPAHQVLVKFRNRTVYSNVVNDGIVPLRTSCLLFLDWQGLDKVEKARRENGLVGTMAEWGWAELTGANASSPRQVRSGVASPDVEDMGRAKDDESVSSDVNSTASPKTHQFFAQPPHTEPTEMTNETYQAVRSSPSSSAFGLFGSFFSLLRSKEQRTSPKQKHTKIYRRSQTIRPDSNNLMDSNAQQRPSHGVARGDSIYDDQTLNAPPRTTIFESAGDVLNPPLPPPEFILNPSSRPRTIFHDRVYHPEDIPTPTNRRRTTIFNTSYRNSLKLTGKASTVPPEPAQHSNGLEQVSSAGGMKVEEKIARAYHRNLSWRKVLVRLEPDAHNNIIVRRMFANAYGWPVIKHLVDTHFGHTLAAETYDSLESNVDRAKPLDKMPSETGEEVISEDDAPKSTSTRLKAQRSEYDRYSENSLGFRDSAVACSSQEGSAGLGLVNDEFSGQTEFGIGSRCSEASRQDSDRWTDRYFDDGDADGHYSDSTIEHGPPD